MLCPRRSLQTRAVELLDHGLQQPLMGNRQGKERNWQCVDTWDKQHNAISQMDSSDAVRLESTIDNKQSAACQGVEHALFVDAPLYGHVPLPTWLRDRGRNGVSLGETAGFQRSWCAGEEVSFQQEWSDFVFGWSGRASCERLSYCRWGQETISYRANGCQPTVTDYVNLHGHVRNVCFKLPEVHDVKHQLHLALLIGDVTPFNWDRSYLTCTISLIPAKY